VRAQMSSRACWRAKRRLSATGSLTSGSGDGASVVLMYSLRILATDRHELACRVLGTVYAGRGRRR
jgi:hypothetical protein